MEARAQGEEAMSPASLPRATDPVVLPGLDGLSEAQATQRMEAGQCNTISRTPTRTVKEIVRANVVTRFNAILGALLLVILTIGPFQDALFGIVLVSNTL